MRFHGIMVVRDECDVIAETIAHHLSWADSLAICDHASTDGTREIIEALARQDRRISLFKVGPVPFTNAFRAMVFEQVRQSFDPGDWIAITDADEMFHVAPPQFVRDCLSPDSGSVHSLHLDFVLTRSEAAGLEDPAICLQDRSRSIVDRRTKFAYSPYGEFRLFRYRRSMHWPTSKYEPLHPGLLAPQRIPIRHYRARDPLQLQSRCNLRISARRTPIEHHWNLHWTDLLCNDDSNLHVFTPRMGLPKPIPTFAGLSPARRIIGAVAYSDIVICGLDLLRAASQARERSPLQGSKFPRATCELSDRS